MIKVLCILYCITLCVLLGLLFYYIHKANWYEKAADKEYREKLKLRCQRDIACDRLASQDRLMAYYEKIIKKKSKED